MFAIPYCVGFPAVGPRADGLHLIDAIARGKVANADGWLSAGLDFGQPHFRAVL